MARRTAQRLRTHAALALASSTVAGLAVLVAGVERWIAAVTVATGYVSAALIGAVLLIGPLRVLRGRPDPVHLYLRRDIGLWAFVNGSAHAVIGLRVYFHDEPWRYFARATPAGTRLLTDLFGTSNWLGFAASMLLVVLALVSNDLVLRRLRARRWKRVQRLTYPMALLALVHTVGYQIYTDRPLGPVLLFAVLVAGVLAARVAAVRAGVGTRSGTATGPTH